MELLIVVDMQNDFVGGALETKEAVGIVPYVVGRVVDSVNRDETILFTGTPMKRMIRRLRRGRTCRHPIASEERRAGRSSPQLTEYTQGRTIVDKPTFGSPELGTMLTELNQRDPIGKITLIGLCTDICVISNAMLVKAFLPEVPVAVNARCCAGVTPESHANALAAMQVCQIAVENP